MTPIQPSPIDVLRRWPRAIMLVSALALSGDVKHSADGREMVRGGKLPPRYDGAYSDEKRMRHAARRFDGQEIDPEFGTPHRAAEAWHAINALEDWCRQAGWTVDDIIEMFSIHPEQGEKAEEPVARERVPGYDLYVGDVLTEAQMLGRNRHELPAPYVWSIDDSGGRGHWLYKVIKHG